jgi:hypothetical protein
VLLTQLCFAQPVSLSANQGGWFWQNPLPQGNTLNSVKFINLSVGWAVGRQAGQGFVETEKMILIK